MTSFRAFRVEKTEDRQFPRSIVERDVADLPEGDLLIDVAWSSLNYKDGLSATGNPGVTRNFPHTPGIDAAGTVVESSSSDFSPGAAVIAIGFDLGMNTPGGFGQKVRIPAGWAIPLPDGLDARSSMVLGTAGFTAALSVHKLEGSGMRPDGGPVLVTGATGGVGSIAVKLLAHLGYEVHAVTGKTASHDFLRGLGAREILSREDALQGAPFVRGGRRLVEGLVDLLQQGGKPGGIGARQAVKLRKEVATDTSFDHTCLEPLYRRIVQAGDRSREQAHCVGASQCPDRCGRKPRVVEWTANGLDMEIRHSPQCMHRSPSGQLRSGPDLGASRIHELPELKCAASSMASTPGPGGRTTFRSR